MEAIPYKAKSGVQQFRPRASESEIMEGGLGFCLACGKETDGCEPDMRRAICHECGAPKLYGMEELVLMGLVEFEKE